jgi:FKBP-type peptidyl-prolyl cis-trans isomerase 2
MINEKDLIEIDLILKDNDTKEIIDTTFQNIAKESNLSTKAEFKPIKVIFGRNELIKGVEDSIKDMDAGKTKTFVLTKEKAFGDKNPNNVKMISLNEFKKEGIKPEAGMQVTIGKETGKVISVSGGRIKVDMNPLYAGRDLEYTITINKIYKDDKEKMPILVEKVFYFMPKEQIKQTYDDKEKMVELELPFGLPKEFDYFKELFAQVALESTNVSKIKYSQVFARKENK